MSLPSNTKLNSPLLDVIVIGARTVEFETLKDEISSISDLATTNDLEERMRGSASFPVFSIPSKLNRVGSTVSSHISVGVMECAEMGNVSAAINTAFAISRHEPKLIIFSGIAGSLDSANFRIGDVVIPRRVQTRYFQKFKTFE